MNWIKQNYKQIAVAALSLADGYALHAWPQYHDTIIGIGAALAMVGLHLNAVTYGDSK